LFDRRKELLQLSKRWDNELHDDVVDGLERRSRSRRGRRRSLGSQRREERRSRETVREKDRRGFGSSISARVEIGKERDEGKRCIPPPSPHSISDS